MNAIVITLAASSLVLALFGVIVSLRRIARRLSAERAWVKAVQKHDSQSEQLMLDLTKEGRILQRVLSRSVLGEEYLAQALADIVQQFAAEQTLSQDAVKEITAALNQPSRTGRREYARKLVQEGLKGRVQIA